MIATKSQHTGGPVFPFEYHNQTSRHQEGFFGTGMIAPGGSQQFAGMTLRDYFAAKAMQAILSDGSWYGHTCKTAAFESYEMADALLQARGD